ncbi:hypothetical protein LTR70_010415 [Exophiala xenobiotica]|uniref:Uncharacterized protein n=1 Tax=Lithohypha guttulata TaxID=1690604 RepID=A0ABR0JVM0_9EURO|nr:hypothetical protein LTR24_010387 [Lithohypha guttulata]KAK5309295.1 hypothetical protein LTR70_010415 [Exophiala xenobiotica]
MGQTLSKLNPLSATAPEPPASTTAPAGPAPFTFPSGPCLSDNAGVATASPSGPINIGKKRSADNASLSAPTTAKRPRTNTSADPVFYIQMVRQNEQAAKSMQKLLDTYRKDPDRIWIIDFGFMSTSGTSPVPFQVSICTMNDNDIITAPINYKMSVSQLSDTILPHTFKPANRHLRKYGNRRLQQTLQKTYGVHHSTFGSTISEVHGQVAAKFTDDIVLVHWGGPELELFTRIMTGSDHPIAPKVSARYPGVDACVIARAGMNRGMTGESNALEDIHRVIFGQGAMQFHTARDDVTATKDILRYFISQCR